MDEITLLDCNHLTSAEYRGGNLNSNAFYTNKLGEGIKVNQGDKVSVHQTYISEVGSDDNAIQITNKFIKKRNITYTQQTPANYLQYPDNDFMLGYKSISASNITEEIELTENKAPILYNYYITNHGEIAYHLPRRFVYLDGVAPDWNEQRDEVSQGKIFGNTCLYTEIGASFNRDFMNAFYCDEDYFLFQTGLKSASGSNHIKGISNNSRFKIFTQTDTRYADVGGDDLISASLTSPAGLDYIEYIEKLDIELDSGFKSPESIASSITSTLRKQSQPQINKLISTATKDAVADNQTYRHLNTEINSPTYHSFPACSEFSNSSLTYNVWDTSTSDDDTALSWLASHQFIGIKRPELWKAGREFNKFYLEYLQSVSPTSYPNILYTAFPIARTLNASEFSRDATGDNIHTIIFPVFWSNKEFMNKMNNIFNEQAKHPELFDNKFNQYFSYTNVNNSRFLHLNVRRDSVRRAVDPVYELQLGTDYLKTNGSVPYMNSVPIFFDFNPTYKNIQSEGNSWEEGYSYGVFKRVDFAGFSYVAVTTSHLGIIEDTNLNASFTTIPNCLFLLNDGTLNGSNIDAYTRLGWDSHFLSYGNVCVGLNSGWASQYPQLEPADSIYQRNIQLPTAYDNTYLQSHELVQKVYLGANEPLIEYNTTSNRFEISNLHTAERVQNRWCAGAIVSGTEIKPFETAGQRVYKINKRLNNNSWNPDMLPYGANNHTLKINGQDYDNDFLNPNLSAWTIYDQYSGIIINDFGYDENSWGKGFWNNLGFDYNQFNAIETSANDITTRVGNDNINNLPYAFTNADVGQLATMDFITNAYGNGMYNLQLPCTVVFNDENSGVDRSNYFREDRYFEQYPAITESATSVKLQAPRLPRKLQSPYFCIRSDILDHSLYLGGYDSGTNHPIIATVPKSNDYGDYFVSLDSTLEFVFTRAKTITEIKTSIHNPDMTLANVDEASSVIYKITKNIPDTRFNIIQQVLSQNKKSAKI
jgi:hypothetical protein